MDLQVKVLRREKGKGKVDSYGRFFIYGASICFNLFLEAPGKGLLFSSYSSLCGNGLSSSLELPQRW